MLGAWAQGSLTLLYQPAPGAHLLASKPISAMRLAPWGVELKDR